jgi:hypothetical protein
MKKAALVFVICIVLIALAFLPVWDWIYSLLRTPNRDGSFSQLHFKSLAGDYDIYIDGEKLGTVKSGEIGDFTKIALGNRNVKIIRSSSNPDFYYILERNLVFIASAQVEIEWEAGPTLESSSGVVKYFTEVSKPEGAELYVLPFPNNATVEFDMKRSENNSFEILDVNPHSIKVSLDKGFESQTLSVNMTDTNNQKVLRNLKLVIEVYLYKVPIE